MPNRNRKVHPEKKRRPYNLTPDGRLGYPFKYETAEERVLAVYQQSAKTRNYEFALSFPEFCAILSSPCHYCGDAPATQIDGGRTRRWKAFKFNGIDRQNNSLGYTTGNCVACCIVCNRLKMDLNHDEFIAHISKILDKQADRWAQVVGPDWQAYVSVC